MTAFVWMAAVVGGFAAVTIVVLAALAAAGRGLYAHAGEPTPPPWVNHGRSPKINPATATPERRRTGKVRDESTRERVDPLDARDVAMWEKQIAAADTDTIMREAGRR